MSRSALRWAALNLRCAAEPGLRRTLIAGRAADGRWRPKWDAILDSGWLEAARGEMERVRRSGSRVLTLEDEDYPALLRVSSDPPPFLYVLGRLLREDGLAVAVVGSRRATPYGIEQAERIAGDLAARGFTIVSGLARGIDAASHRGALASGGRTVAVLGSGLDRIYPPEHLKLAREIADRGAVLTEFPFGAAPLKRHFPERNRVIAWLSWTTIVIEASRDSGSLITAGLAADEGRTVHAVPGPVGSPGSEGTNALLRDGALLCRGADDVLDDLGPSIVEAASPIGTGRRGEGGDGDGAPSDRLRPAAGSGSSPEERRVLVVLGRSRPMSIDRLGEACDLSPGALLATLLELELRGLVRRLPGRLFGASTCKI